MQPDDAADLLSELPQEQAEQLLAADGPGRGGRRPPPAEPTSENTAGGLMTTEPVVLSPDATVAEALARVRREEISPALAAAVFVCRPPLDTPTGRYLGLAAHPADAPRAAGHARSARSSTGTSRRCRRRRRSRPLTRRLATYNLVSLPVTDDAGRLVGVVTVDDVLDHLLPRDWRDADDDLGDVTGELPRVR